MLEGENDREREAESPQATGPESDADKNCILEPGLLVPGLGLLWWAVPIQIAWLFTQFLL